VPAKSTEPKKSGAMIATAKVLSANALHATAQEQLSFTDTQSPAAIVSKENKSANRVFKAKKTFQPS
jgi:hypothetical protein